MKEKILDIFYNSIIPEAEGGRIDCFFTYNIIFNTIVENRVVTNQIVASDLIIPTLNIKDKNRFDDLLVEYVVYANDFYDNSNYPEEILNDVLYDENKVCKEKYLLTLLFASATFEDFANPILFLQRRIDFIKNSHQKEISIGNSNILSSNIKINIDKDIINNETPYEFIITLSNQSNTFIFPKIKFGISDNIIYIYAIQNDILPETTYSKKINRALYKVGEGFDKKIDNYELYKEGNLNDITHSFLYAVNIFVSYFYNIGYANFKISSILPERWNSKTTASRYKYEKGKVDDEGYAELQIKQLQIQRNLTEKFLRTFLRLQHHYNGIEVLSYPMEADSYLNLFVNNLECCNNSLLQEANNLINNYFSQNITK